MQSMIERIAALPLLARTASEDVWKVTGPLAFTHALGQGAHTGYPLYPSFWFYPEHYSGINYAGVADRCYARHFWGSTMHSGSTRVSETS